MESAIAVALCLGVTIDSSGQQAAKRSQSANVKRQISAFDSVPFDPSVERLPPDYKGHDLRRIITNIAKLEQLQKSEFETTASFQTRREEAYSSVLYGRIRMKDIVAISVRPDTQYFAEAEQFHVRIPVSKAMSGSDTTTRVIENKDAITVFYDIHDRESYTATNAFGAVTTVDVSDTEIYQLALDPPSTIPKEKYERTIGEDTKLEVEGLYLIFNVSLTTAPKIKDNLRVLFIVQPEAPFLYQYVDHHIPTFDDPRSGSTTQQALMVNLREVWLYDFKSGKVLERVRALPVSP
jgi:hypothetical protein